MMRVRYLIVIIFACALAFPGPIGAECNQHVKRALDWVEQWKDRVRGSSTPLGHLRLLATQARITSQTLTLKAGAKIINEFDEVLKSVHSNRERANPDRDPMELRRAFEDRILYQTSWAGNAANGIANCITTAVSDKFLTEDAIALGDILLLDTFLNPSLYDWMVEASELLRDSGRRNREDLSRWFYLVYNINHEFSMIGDGNWLKCQNVIKDMHTNPNFKFRLRNRRDPQDPQTILYLPPEVVVTSYAKVRNMCSR